MRIRFDETTRVEISTVVRNTAFAAIKEATQLPGGTYPSVFKQVIMGLYGKLAHSEGSRLSDLQGYVFDALEMII